MRSCASTRDRPSAGSSRRSGRVPAPPPGSPTAPRAKLAEALVGADAARKAAQALQDPRARQAALEKATQDLEAAHARLNSAPTRAVAEGLLAPSQGAVETSPQASEPNVQGDDAEDIRSLEITPANPTMDGSAAVDFTATGTDSIGDPVDLSYDVEWTSDKPAVLEIGLLTGKATAGRVSGKVRVTALHKPSNRRAVTNVTVALKPMLGPQPAPPKKPVPELQSLAITPADPKLEIGSAKPLKAVGTYSVGPPQDETAAVVWESTDDKVATVDAKGVVRAVGVGTATVSATESNSQVIGWTQVEVVPLAVRGLTIESTTYAILPADLQPFTALLEYENGSSQQLRGGVTWTSSRPEVVKIDGDGQAMGRKSGTAEISASYDIGDGTVVTAKATVTVPRLVGLEVKPANPTVAVGQEERFQAIGVYEGGLRRDVGLVSWLAANDAVGLHGAVGTGRRAGTVEVSATLDEDRSIRGTTTVTVVDAKASRLRIEPVSPSAFAGTLVTGDRMQFRALGVFELGSGKQALRPVPVTWSSDTEKVLAVDAKGLARALGAGKAMLGAEADGGLNVSVRIQVKAAPASTTPARPDGVFPASVTQPFDDAQRKFDALQVEVRALDAIPPFVRKLEDVLADLAKNPDIDAIRDARHARDQQIAVKGVMSQLKVFETSVKSIQRHLASIEEATKDFEGRKKVAELHEEAVHEKERLKSWLEAVEVGAIIEENPVEALAKLGTILIDNFHVPAAQTEADELEKELDKQRVVTLKADAKQAEEDRGTAKTAIDEARRQLGDLKDSVEGWRQLAGQDFDAADAANGIFNFSELAEPLAQAEAIASKSAPEVRRAADAAYASIEHYGKSTRLEKGGEPAVALKAMGDAALQWRVQATQVLGQAEKLRDQLKQTRDAALAALAKLKPKAKVRKKTTRMPGRRP